MTTKSTASPLPDLVLVGHPFARSGRGEDLRASLEALRKVGLNPRVRDIFRYNAPDPVMHARVGDCLTDDLSARVNLFFINGDEVAPVFEQLADHCPEGAYNIVYPAWELAHYPAPWAEQLGRFAESWAMSRFTGEALSAAGVTPVIAMPSPSEPLLYGFRGRRALGLPETGFLFLFFFDFDSYIERKNPFATVRAYERFLADHPQANAKLIIKTSNSDRARPQDVERLKAAMAAVADSSLLIDRSLEDLEIKNLVRACDCFVSLHRAEGYGRGVAEAMFYGKPTIATGYSGVLDFLTPETGCLVNYQLIPVAEGAYPFWQDQQWADPDWQHAADFMGRVYRDRLWRTELGNAASRHMRVHFSAQAAGLRYLARLRQIPTFAGS